jgi:hypothetical protein
MTITSRFRRALIRACPFAIPAAAAAAAGCLLLATGTVASPLTAFAWSGATLLTLAGFELGQILALRCAGIRVRVRVLFPLFALHDASGELARRSVATDCWVTIAGPVAGTSASFLAIGLHALTDYAPLAPVALVGFGFNAILMLPVPGFPGGDIALAISAWLYAPGFAFLAGTIWWAGTVVDGTVLVIVRVGALLLLGIGVTDGISALRGRRARPPLGQRLALLVGFTATWLAIVRGFDLLPTVGGAATFLN